MQYIYKLPHAPDIDVRKPETVDHWWCDGILGLLGYSNPPPPYTTTYYTLLDMYQTHFPERLI